MRPYALVGELLLTDDTTYIRLATYEAADMEAALRRAVAVVRRWRRERIVDHPGATVRDVIEVQVGEDHAALSRRSGASQEEQEGEEREKEPPRLADKRGETLRLLVTPFAQRPVRTFVHGTVPL